MYVSKEHKFMQVLSEAYNMPNQGILFFLGKQRSKTYIKVKQRIQAKVQQGIVSKKNHNIYKRL